MKFNKWTVALAAAGLVIGHNAQAEEGYISALSKTTLSGFVDTSLSLSEQSTGTSIAGRVPYQGRQQDEQHQPRCYSTFLGKPHGRE